MFKFNWNTSILTKKPTASESQLLDQMNDTLTNELYSLKKPSSKDQSVSKAELIFHEVMKRSKTPPFIIGGIDIDHFDMGHVSPNLCLKHIQELSDTAFRAIFHLKYSGDASLSLKTSVEANHLKLSEGHRKFVLPVLDIAARSLPVPLRINVTEFDLEADFLISYKKDKGLKVIFMDDEPLKSLSVSSSFDFLPSVAVKIKNTIYERLSEIVRDDIPICIYKVTETTGTTDNDLSDESGCSTGCSVPNAVVQHFNGISTAFNNGRSTWNSIKTFFHKLFGLSTNLSLAQEQLLAERSSLCGLASFNDYATKGFITGKSNNHLYSDAFQDLEQILQLDTSSEASFKQLRSLKHHPRRRKIKLNELKRLIEEPLVEPLAEPLPHAQAQTQAKSQLQPGYTTPVASPQSDQTQPELDSEDLTLSSPDQSLRFLQSPELEQVYSTPKKTASPLPYDLTFSSDSSWLTSSPPNYECHWTQPSWTSSRGISVYKESKPGSEPQSNYKSQDVKVYTSPSPDLSKRFTSAAF